MHQGSEGAGTGDSSSAAALDCDEQQPIASSSSAAGAVPGSTASAAAKKNHSNIYLRGLPENITEEGLRALVSPFGSVQSVRIYYAQKTLTFGAKCTYSFVKFSSVHEAQAAIAALDGAVYAGNTLQARLAVRDVDASTVLAAGQKPPASDNIYCKNLPSSLRDNELRAVFSAYGAVVSCRVLRQGNATGLGGAALVRFASVEAAAAALEALQGSRFPGSLHPLVIRFADSQEMKERKQAERFGLGEGSGPGSGSLQGAVGGSEGAGSQDCEEQEHESGRPGSSLTLGQRTFSGGSVSMRQATQRHASQRQHAGGQFWQPPVNPYSSLDSRPPEAAAPAQGYVQVAAGQGPSSSSRYPPDTFAWHAVPMYVPHGQQLLMMPADASLPGGSGLGYAGGDGAIRPAEAVASGRGTDLYGRVGSGAVGMGGRGMGIGATPGAGMQGGGALPQRMGGDAGDTGGGAASGSFLPVRYMAAPHPGYVHVPQMPGATVGTAPYFPAGPSSNTHGIAQPAWGLQPPGSASGSATPTALAGPGLSSLPTEHMPARALHTVYCSNLPEHADRLYLYECFAPFGAILSIKVLKDKKGNSRLAAFINYVDAAGAARAVAAMNNLPVGNNRHLHVALRNP